MHRLSVIKMLFPWFMLLALTSCGTTTGNNDSAGGGIGGTGISVGKITAADSASVDVNGVAFDITNATVTVDGVSGNQNNLKVGMIVKVDGTFNPDGKTGIAANIEFKDILEGPVDSVSPTLVVLGQTVSVSSSTHYDFADINSDGTIDVNDLGIGNIVEVSGFVDAGGVIHATYISLKSGSIVEYGSDIELKGTITELDKNLWTFKIGGLTIYYLNAEFEHMTINDVQDRLYVEVKSTAGITGTALIASAIELEDKGHNPDEGDEFEVEGYVTDTSVLLAENKFELEGQTVLITSNTIFENGINIDNIMVNVKLEVEGIVDEYGVLVADKIEIKAGDDGDSDDSSESDHVENGENDPS